MQKKILILQAGASQKFVIKLANEMNLLTIALDKNPNAPGFQEANISECIDPIDAESCLKIAKKYNIDAILPAGDITLRSAAYVSEALGLVGLSPEQAEIASDKEKYICAFKKAGIPYPDAEIIDTIDECNSFIKDQGLPVVIKPTTSYGASRGVKRVQKNNELMDAFTFAKQYSKNGRIIIEKFFEGEEHTVESLIKNGTNHVLAISDKERICESYCMATSINYPSQLPNNLINKIELYSQKIAKALKLKDWITHSEMITGKDGVHVIDFAARGGSAGYIPTVIVPEVCGVRMMEEYIRLLIRQKPQSLHQNKMQGVIYGFFTPIPGRLEKIEGLDEVRKDKNLIDIGFFVKPGDIVNPLRTQVDRAGYFVVKGDSFIEAKKNSRNIQESVRMITTEDNS
jgi:biotin carboxylase